MVPLRKEGSITSKRRHKMFLSVKVMCLSKVYFENLAQR